MRSTNFGIAAVGALLRGLAVAVLIHGASVQAQVPPAPTAAQADADVEQAMQNERDLVTIPDRRLTCPVSGDGEIVVCARDHSSRYRVQSSADENPLSREALRTGALHPPDVYTHPNGGVSTGFGHVPPPIYYIDTTKLPAPAPGTDADKIAKGEMAAP